MPYFKYTIQAQENALDQYRIHYYWEVPSGGTESATTKCMDGNKGQTSSCPYKTKYEMLPHSLKSCLDYCALLFSLRRNTMKKERMMVRLIMEKEGCFNYAEIDFDKLEKERIVRLMVAEGLIEEKASGEGDDSSLEDIACSLMDELVGRGMLIQHFFSSDFTTWIEIPPAYYGLCVVEVDKEDFVARSDRTPIRVSIKHFDHGTGISPHLKNLPIQSLFIFGGCLFSDQATIDTICGLRSLLVLQWEGLANDHISFSKIGELINLKVLTLSVFSSLSSEITRSLSNFQHLQTLELSSNDFNNKVLEEVATIKTLRHLLCLTFRLPKGIGRLVNLQTLVRWDARSEVIDELSSLNQLRRLDVHHVADENIKKLLGTISSMKKLISLSMSTDIHQKYSDIFPLLEPFLPPPHLQELCLVGTLMELPDWFNSLKNLTILVLCLSSLTEDPSTTFQFLPNLKFLCLDRAYKAKFIGKEFCNKGGFPKLEILEIRSFFLVGWTEIVEGAFPSLTSFSCVSRGLRIFPEGVQHISKLQSLELVVHGDLIRRLNGDENYKIKHISSVSMSS